MKRFKTYHLATRSRLTSLLMLFVVLCSSIFSSCSNEDDVSLIFNGKYKITVYCFNNGVDNVKNKQLNKNKSVFHLTFTQGTFVGVLDEGTTIEGTFKVNASSREIHFDRVSVRPENQTDLAVQITKLIKDATYYSGDCNVLQLHVNGETFITLDSREEIINKI